MSDTALLSKRKQKALIRKIQALETHGKETGDWAPFHTLEALLREYHKCIVQQSQDCEHTKTTTAAIMQKYIAHCDARDAQKTTTATQVTHARKARV